MYVDVDVPTLCPPEIMKMNREIISIKLFGHWGLIQTQRSQEIIQELFNEWKFRSRNSSISSMDTEIDCPTGIQEIQLRIKDNR